MSFAGIRLRGLRKCARPVSRIDKRKTRVNALEQLLDDSDEGSFSSRSSDASDSGLSYNESDDSSASSDSFRPPKKERGGDLGESDEERCATSRRRRKRSASILNEHDDSTDSTESDDGGEPVRKAKQKKRLKLSDSEDESDLEREKVTKIKEAAAKRKERKSKLVELLKQRKTASARRRRRTLGSEEEDEAENVEPESQGKAEDSENESSEEHPVRLIDSSEEEKQADTDSLKDFIVEDEVQKEKEEDEEVEEEETPNKDFFTHLPREFITGSQFTHFQVVIKALLINALDTSFLQSLYDGERTKRYAKEMKSSLHYFDERLVLPRLENLKQRSRWKERYKERVECYPKVRVIMVNVKTRNCEACELHRNGRFRVHLSGQLYHSTTLQEDQFMPDDSQTFLVGSVCASRTEVYHALKHYKYHLYVRCRTALKDHKEAAEEAQEVDDEPVKDTVRKLFTKLQDDGWITRQYEEFEECLNNADFFQEEKLD